jgi:uncharacterized protein
MHKLSFKFTPAGVIAALGFGTAAVMVPPLPMVAGVSSVHFSIIIVIVIGVALVGSAMFYSKGSLIQKYQASLAIIMFSTLYGALGNFFFNFWAWKGYFVEFSWAQVAIMELGGLLTALAYFKLEPIDLMASGGLERLQRGSKAQDPSATASLPEVTNQTAGFQAAESAEDFMKSKGSLKLTSSKTDMQAVVPPQEAVMAKKGGPTSVESAHAIMTPPVEIDLDASDEMLSGPLNPSPTAPAARTPAAGPSAEAKNTNATQSRLQAQKRRNTSTFTKLQALSASGTGSLKPTPVQQDNTGGGDLRSLLDRLDSEPEDVDYESLPTPEEIRVEILFSEETVTGKADAGKPKGFIGKKPEPLVKPGIKEAPKPPVTPARPTPATAGGAGQKPADGNPVGLAGKLQQNKPPQPTGGSPGLANLLDRAEANADEAAVTKGAKEPVKEEAASASADDAGAGMLAKRFMELSTDDEEELEAAPVAEPAAVEEEEKVFNENVDEEIDDIFSSLAPSEAQREVTHADEEPTEEDRAVAPAEEEAPETHAQIALPEPEAFEAPVSQSKKEVIAEEEEARAEEAEPEPVEDGLIFNQGVDNDIDDVFSNLAPAEAQLNVGDVKLSKAAEEEVPEETAAEPAEEEEGLIFNQGVDEDIDDVFSNLAPAEAQLNVGDVKLRKAAEEEQVSEDTAAEPAEEEGLIFNQGVDEDIDDVFSNLAPAEAQLNVGDVKLKAKSEAEPAVQDQDETGDFTASKFTEKETPGEESEVEEGLFNLGDSDVDDIFAGLAGEQLDVNAETLAKVKDGEGEEAEVPIPASLVETGDRIPVISAESAKTAKQTGDMPAMSKEQAAKIKDDIKKAADGEEDDETEDEESKQEAVPDSPEAAKLKKELKEFGKLSARSATAPKATGDSVGTMKTIGKLLIDNQAIENIIKAGEQRKLGQNLATARIISQARGQGIMELLHKIDKYEGVFGSIIVGHDGLVMASTLKDGWDKDIMGALSTALLSTSNLTTKKLEIGKLRQMIMLTKSGNQEKTTVLTDVDVGILAVFVEETDISKIDGMLDIIHKTIHG